MGFQRRYAHQPTCPLSARCVPAGQPQNRIHLTQKPLEVMRGIVRITEPGGHILDPFAGSGTTVLAVVREGYTATGVELSQEYARLAEERVRTELEKEPLSDGGETVNQPQAA